MVELEDIDDLEAPCGRTLGAALGAGAKQARARRIAIGVVADSAPPAARRRRRPVADGPGRAAALPVPGVV